MDQITAWLDGKKTNLVSAWVFCGALYMAMNGIGDDQLNALMATVATLAATMRAAQTKAAGLVPVLVGGLAVSLLMLGGCASLGMIDPATGTSPAQDIVQAAGETAALFGPVIGAAVPIGLASLLSIIIALGKVEDEELVE